MLSLRNEGNGAPDFGAIRIGIANAGMRILLDECAPWPMHKLLVSHDWFAQEEWLKFVEAGGLAGIVELGAQSLQHDFQHWPSRCRKSKHSSQAGAGLRRQLVLVRLGGGTKVLSQRGRRRQRSPL